MVTRRDLFRLVAGPAIMPALAPVEPEQQDKWFDHWLIMPGQRIVANEHAEGFTYFNGTNEPVDVVLWRARL